jgi:hypothetical protein
VPREVASKRDEASMPDRVPSTGAAQATETIATSATRQTLAIYEVKATVEFSDLRLFERSLQCVQRFGSPRHHHSALRCSARLQAQPNAQHLSIECCC